MISLITAQPLSYLVISKDLLFPSDFNERKCPLRLLDSEYEIGVCAYE